MRAIIASIEQEYGRYRKLGSGTLDQIDEAQLRTHVSEESNSMATLVWHVSGNLESRFTDLLTTDGEKPWRNREDEFAVREASAEEVAAKWARGWNVLESALAELTDADLGRAIAIRGVEHTVTEALHRSLAHTAYHVGQMTFVGKMLRGAEWTYLSIAPGGTAAYNQNPTREKG
jgi:uncharacterized damage-inducible protein DinB